MPDGDAGPNPHSPTMQICLVAPYPDLLEPAHLICANEFVESFIVLGSFQQTLKFAVYFASTRTIVFTHDCHCRSCMRMIDGRSDAPHPSVEASLKPSFLSLVDCAAEQTVVLIHLELDVALCEIEHQTLRSGFCGCQPVMKGSDDPLPLARS